ncbi:hypothetical protein [Helicobacter sp.]|nr:hypothetical protein [Helicobacter sp.]MDY5556234.1 hypothetical protein [Helicobacter sp.]
MESLQARFYIIDCYENFTNFLAMTKWQTLWILVIAKNAMAKQSII